MGTTASGFWYPDETTPMTLRGMFSAAATAAETALQNELVSGGVPTAGSAAALTAKFTAAGTAPALGNQGSIGGLSVVWNGSSWVSTSERSGAEVVRPSAQNMGTGAWSAVTWSTSSIYSQLFDIPGPSGITIPVTGWYRCEANGSFNGSVNGRRLVGFGPTSAGQPTSSFNTVTASGYSGTYTISYTQTMRFSAGALITGWFFQDSGTTLSRTASRLHIELVHAD